jgi:murein L,D-transpeptidase YafK
MIAIHARADDFPDSQRAREAAARVTPALKRDLAAKNLHFGAPIYLRIFKREGEMELWLRADDTGSKKGKYILFRTYPICKFSGELGPKRREGDKQAPEGFYTVAPDQLNPNSDYHLAFNLGYPNEFDRAHGYTGSELMVHGRCVSVGCYAMGDAGIEEIYTLAVAALRAGQGAFSVHVFPFRPTSDALAAQKGSPWFDFWSELKPAYDDFERTRVPPRVTVENARYRLELQ